MPPDKEQSTGLSERGKEIRANSLQGPQPAQALDGQPRAAGMRRRIPQAPDTNTSGLLGQRGLARVWLYLFLDFGVYLAEKLLDISYEMGSAQRGGHGSELGQRLALPTGFLACSLLA